MACWRCSRQMTLSDDIPLVTESSRAQLNPRQLVDYEEHRRTVFEWLATTGKHPERAEGYSQAVVKNTAYRTDAFYRWVWDRDKYTTALSHAQADAYLREIAGRDLTTSSKNLPEVATVSNVETNGRVPVGLAAGRAFDSTPQ